MSKKLLDLIASVEAPNGYDTLYANAQRRYSWKLTDLTLDEVLRLGPQWARKPPHGHGSSACGRYQFMAGTNHTLAGLKKELGLVGNEIFNEALQDRLGLHLLRRRGYDKWLRGELSHDAFMIGLAREWASFPIPYDMKVGNRHLKRGQSYYAGDGLNKAHLSATNVWLFLRDLRDELTAKPPAPEIVPEPALDVDEVPDDPDDNIWAALQAALTAKDMTMLQVVLAPFIAEAVKEAIKKGVALAAEDRSIPLQPAAAPAVEAKIQQVAEQEIASRVAHQTNTEEDFWRKRSFWSAFVAGVVAPAAAALGYELAPEGQQQVTTVVTWMVTNLWAAYLAYRAGTAKKPLGR